MYETWTNRTIPFGLYMTDGAKKGGVQELGWDGDKATKAQKKSKGPCVPKTLYEMKETETPSSDNFSKSSGGPRHMTQTPPITCPGSISGVFNVSKGLGKGLMLRTGRPPPVLTPSIRRGKINQQSQQY